MRARLALLCIATALLLQCGAYHAAAQQSQHSSSTAGGGRPKQTRSTAQRVKRQRSRAQSLLQDAKDLYLIAKTRVMEEWVGPYMADVTDSYALFTYRLAHVLRGWHGRFARARRLARIHRSRLYMLCVELQSRVPLLEQSVDTDVLVIGALAVECFVAGWVLVRVLRLMYS